MNAIHRRVARVASTVAIVCIVAVLGGCAQYQIGANSLYRADIRTVHVPVFKSESFRPYLGELVTEAVVKQIELETPYKVVPAPNADSVLTGRLVQVDKKLLTESPNDDARDIQVEFVVQITWIDRRGEIIMQRTVAMDGDYIPEGGQSIAADELQIARRLAREIVTQMQNWW